MFLNKTEDQSVTFIAWWTGLVLLFFIRLTTCEKKTFSNNNKELRPAGNGKTNQKELEKLLQVPYYFKNTGISREVSGFIPAFQLILLDLLVSRSFTENVSCYDLWNWEEGDIYKYSHIMIRENESPTGYSESQAWNTFQWGKKHHWIQHFLQLKAFS